MNNKYYNIAFSGIKSVNGILKAIKPNFNKIFKIYKIIAILFPISFILSMVLFGILFIREFNVVLITIPLLTFVLGIAFMIFCLVKVTYAVQVEGIIRTIELKDKTLIVSISQAYREKDMILIVKKLLEAGFLSDYENIGDIMLAKKELHISESEARKEYNEEKGIKTDNHVKPTYAEADSYNVTYCPECGNKNKIYDNYCSNCGRRINNDSI